MQLTLCFLSGSYKLPILIVIDFQRLIVNFGSHDVISERRHVRGREATAPLNFGQSENFVLFCGKIASKNAKYGGQKLPFGRI